MKKPQPKIDYLTLFRETAMRAHLQFPLDEQELDWYDEGMTPEFAHRLIESLDAARP